MRRRLVGLATTLVIVAAPLAAEALPATGPVGETAPVVVTLTTMHPIAPQPEDTLVLRGTITNASDAQISALAVQLRMSGPISARSTFDAFADEAGLLLCTWPEGGMPFYPFVYSDEVWTGIEYQVASHLAFEGLEEEARAVLRGIRQRYDGVRRNPWNEFECGSHYARALASRISVLTPRPCAVKSPCLSSTCTSPSASVPSVTDLIV